MTELRRIRDHVQLALSEDFLAADDPRMFDRLDKARDTEVMRADIDVSPLGDLVDKIINATKPGDAAAIDRMLAVELHPALPITRGEAADMCMWAWLGWQAFPHFVAHRWPLAPKTNLRSAERFVGNVVRQSFARLWWAAELTVDDKDDYSLLEEILALDSFQDFYEACFGRTFCQYRPALEQFIQVAGPLSAVHYRQLAKEFGYSTTTLVLEALSANEIKTLLVDLKSKLLQR